MSETVNLTTGISLNVDFSKSNIEVFFFIKVRFVAANMGKVYGERERERDRVTKNKTDNAWVGARIRKLPSEGERSSQDDINLR